jgi:hypothetical protein
VIDPLGAELVTASLGETILFADLHTDHVAGTRDHFRFLQDRRVVPDTTPRGVGHHE